ncbi:MAG: hypothetical protein GSR84_00160, partial [Desulfurococcales archaeon]|nr:hypothetical protein [Desulfurococcales archaeon]
GGLLVLPSLEPGTRLGPLDPWTPKEACTSIHPLAPDEYTGTVEEKGSGYTWRCTYKQGVLQELVYQEQGYTLEMRLEQGPGSLAQALAVLAATILLAVLGLAWLRHKAKNM